MIVAPMPVSPCATKSSSTPSAPPSMPCVARPLRVANAHSCSRVPPTPSGLSTLWSGPAAYPSSEMEKLCTRSFGIGVSLHSATTAQACRTHRSRFGSGERGASERHARCAAGDQVLELLQITGRADRDDHLAGPDLSLRRGIRGERAVRVAQGEDERARAVPHVGVSDAAPLDRRALRDRDLLEPELDVPLVHHDIEELG